MLIHAFPRKAEYHYEFQGATYKFKLNDEGHAVADVQDDTAISWFLKHDDHFRLYRGEAKPAAKVAKPAAAPASAIGVTDEPEQEPEQDAEPEASNVISDGENTIDLGALDEAALKAFAKDNGITVHGKLKGENLRNAIVAALKG